MVLFDLPAKEGPKNGIVIKAIDRPEEAQARAAGRLADDAALIQQANYEDDMEQARASAT